MGKRVLIAGGAGFIGANLCRRLVGEGNDVLCLDNLQTGRLENLRGLANLGNFRFMRHDVNEPFPAEILGRVDRVYNLACPASPAHYQRDKAKTLLTNVLGAKNALDYALKSDQARILQASTSEVYGDPTVHPQVESYVGHVNPVGPRACYDEGKRAAETLFFAYREKYGLPVRIARIFNTYGPGMSADDGRVVSNFIVQALRGEPLTIYGNGSQTRSFCFVSDLVEGLIRLMEMPPADFTGPVNLGNPNEFTIGELAERIREKFGGGIRIETLPLPVDDPKMRRPDIALARKTLAWEPRVELEEGIEKTVEYFRALA